MGSSWLETMVTHEPELLSWLSGERAEHALRLLDVAAGVGVLGVELEHATPLLDGGLEALLAEEPQAILVALLHQTRADIAEQGGGVLVPGAHAGELRERAIGLLVVVTCEVRLGRGVQHLRLLLFCRSRNRRDRGARRGGLDARLRRGVGSHARRRWHGRTS